MERVGSTVVAILLCLALLASGCGDDADPTAVPPSGEAGAMLTIGDEEYVLPEESTCVSILTAMTSVFTDGPDTRVEVDLPPLDWETDTASDWEPPEVGLTIRGGEGRRSYRSSPNVGDRYPDTDAPTAVIAEYALGDGWATGSGHVIDTQALVDAEARGTEPPSALPFVFEVVCES